MSKRRGGDKLARKEKHRRKAISFELRYKMSRVAWTAFKKLMRKNGTAHKIDELMRRAIRR